MGKWGLFSGHGWRACWFLFGSGLIHDGVCVLVQAGNKSQHAHSWPGFSELIHKSWFSEAPYLVCLLGWTRPGSFGGPLPGKQPAFEKSFDTIDKSGPKNTPSSASIHTGAEESLCRELVCCPSCLHLEFIFSQLICKNGTFE